MVSDDDIIKACKEANSMAGACSMLRMNYKTFTKRAKNLGVYKKIRAARGSKEI